MIGSVRAPRQDQQEDQHARQSARQPRAARNPSPAGAESRRMTSAGRHPDARAIMLAAGLVSRARRRLPAAAARWSCSSARGRCSARRASDAIDLPLDSVGAQLLLTLGVSLILFYGGLGALDRSPPPGRRRAWAARRARRVLTAVVTGLVAAAAFGRSRSQVGLLIGAVLAPTDPAILIPLFERLRVRPKVVADGHRRVGDQRSRRGRARAGVRRRS